MDSLTLTVQLQDVHKRHILKRHIEVGLDSAADTAKELVEEFSDYFRKVENKRKVKLSKNGNANN